MLTLIRNARPLVLSHLRARGRWCRVDGEATRRGTVE